MLLEILSEHRPKEEQQDLIMPNNDDERSVSPSQVVDRSPEINTGAVYKQSSAEPA